jgi:hypothetical protein
LATLATWLREEHAHLVAVLGGGGVGKTTLAARLAHDLAPAVEYLYWRSLRNALPVEEWLAGAIGLLAEQRLVPPAEVAARLALLRDLLRERPALLVLDNLETVLEPGVTAARYRAGYEGYGEVLQRLGERGHQATLLVTSREPPPELTPTSGRASPGRCCGWADWVRRRAGRCCGRRGWSATRPPGRPWWRITAATRSRCGWWARPSVSGSRARSPPSWRPGRRCPPMSAGCWRGSWAG